MAEESGEIKLTHEEFVKRAILTLRKEPYKGIHTVYSGFNVAFREYFNEDPIECTNKLAKQGTIVLRPVRGGVMLYLLEDAPAGTDPRNTLKKMGL